MPLTNITVMFSLIVTVIALFIFKLMKIKANVLRILSLFFITVLISTYFLTSFIESLGTTPAIYKKLTVDSYGNSNGDGLICFGRATEHLNVGLMPNKRDMTKTDIDLLFKMHGRSGRSKIDGVLKIKTQEDKVLSTFSFYEGKHSTLITAKGDGRLVPPGLHRYEFSLKMPKEYSGNPIGPTLYLKFHEEPIFNETYINKDCLLGEK